MSKQSSYHSFVDSKDSRKMQLGPKITKRLKHKELEAGKEEATAGHQPAAANNKTNPVKKKREKKQDGNAREQEELLQESKAPEAVTAETPEPSTASSKQQTRDGR